MKIVPGIQRAVLVVVALARNWFGLRVPSKAQVRQAEAMLDGYLLGYEDWRLWEYVGRQTRTAPDRGRLAAWRKELARLLPRITRWQAEIRPAFYRDVGFGSESYRQFEATKYRAFIERAEPRTSGSSWRAPRSRNSGNRDSGRTFPRLRLSRSWQRPVETGDWKLAASGFPGL